MNDFDQSGASVPYESSDGAPAFSASDFHPDERVGISLDGACALAEHQRPGSRVQYEPASGPGFVFVAGDEVST